MKITEKRRLGFDSARALAIRENWFTRSDNEHYMNWLKECGKENIDTRTIYELAEYAVQYSDTEDYTNRQEAIESFMFLIARACTSSFEIELYERPWRV